MKKETQPDKKWNAPVHFEVPNEPPESQIALNMVLEMKRAQERASVFWRCLSVGVLICVLVLAFISFYMQNEQIESISLLTIQDRDTIQNLEEEISELTKRLENRKIASALFVDRSKSFLSHKVEFMDDERTNQLRLWADALNTYCFTIGLKAMKVPELNERSASIPQDAPSNSTP